MGNAALSVFLGIFFAYYFKISNTFYSRRVGTIPLQIGIVILGATISMPYALNVSSEYLPWISLFVIISFFSGLILGKILGIHYRVAFLLSSGAAICGGTAMAAVAPIIKAKPQELLITMTIVFLLNAIAIIIYPIAGSYLEMSNFEFGAWSALVIHDTSSVIGTALSYSNESAQAAATLKLGRTIWLIPLILIANWIRNGKAAKSEFHNQSRDARRFLGIIVNPPPTKAAPIAGSRVNEISGPRTTCEPFSTSDGLLKSTCPPNCEPCKTGSCRHRSHA